MLQAVAVSTLSTLNVSNRSSICGEADVSCHSPGLGLMQAEFSNLRRGTNRQVQPAPCIQPAAVVTASNLPHGLPTPPSPKLPKAGRLGARQHKVQKDAQLSSSKALIERRKGSLSAHMPAKAAVGPATRAVAMLR
jgi:hypothetical protein